MKTETVRYFKSTRYPYWIYKCIDNHSFCYTYDHWDEIDSINLDELQQLPEEEAMLELL